MQRMGKDFFCVLVNLVIQSILLLIFLIVSLTTKFWGFLIGSAIGLLVSSLNVFLILKGSSDLLTLSETPSNEDEKVRNPKGKGFFVLFYFVRAIITVGFLVMVILFQYKLNIKAFEWSFIPLIVSLTFIVGVIPLGDIFYKKFVTSKNVTESKSTEKKCDLNEITAEDSEAKSEHIDKDDSNGVVKEGEKK